MTNEQAQEVIANVIEGAGRLVVFASAAGVYLNEGGEGTWDHIKLLSRQASSLIPVLEQAASLEDHFDQIIPF